MYNLNDISLTLQYHLHFLLQYLPYVLLHFLVLLGLRLFLLKLFAVTACSGGWSFFLSKLGKYQFCLLLLMLVFSLCAMMFIFLRFGVIFNFSGDFVFMAGVLLGWRVGWPILMVNLLCLFCWFCFIGRDAVWILYILVDSVIYFATGLFSGMWFHMIDGDYCWSDILLICINKMMAAVISAACWVLLMQESWLAGFNVLLFRLVGWPLASLPMIALLLLLMRQDVRQMCRPAP